MRDYLSVMGIDPGINNIGWAVHRGPCDWITGVKRIDGTLPERMWALWEWLEVFVDKNNVRNVVIESLKGGMPWLMCDLSAGIGVVALMAKKKSLGYAEMSPSVHFYFVSGRGRRSKEYDKMVHLMIGHHDMSVHEQSAVGCVLAAEGDIEKKLPAKIKGKVHWRLLPRRV